MPKLPEIITKKIGPLPLWSYVVIGGVLVFILRKRGGSSSSANPAGTISVPTLTPGTPTDSLGGGAGAVGSPGQNWIAGTDTQPAGAVPWWAIQPSWWAAGPGGGANPATSGGGGGNTGAQSNAPAGVAPKQSVVLGPTADVLSREPVGGWKLPPIFQRIGDTVRDMSGRGPAVGQVSPSNRLLGYSDPVTGNLSPTPNGGPAIWA